MSVVRKHVLLPLISLSILCALAYAITLSSPDSSRGKAKVPTKLGVDAITLSAQDFTITLESFGRVQAKTQTTLIPLVNGQIVWVSPNFVQGGFYRKGEALLRIEQADYLVEVEVAKAKVASAELSLYEEQARSEQAKRDWEKNRKPELATDLALRKPQLKSAQAALDTARAQLKHAELNLQRTVIRAPYDGRVLNIFVDQGSVVGTGTVLAQLYSSDRVEVSLPLSSKDLPFVELPDEINASGDGLDVVLYNPLTSPSESWSAIANRTSAAVDENSQQVSVVAEIESPFVTDNKHSQLLKIGQYVRAEIIGRTLEDVIVVSNEMIYQGSYVYTVRNDHVQRTPVDILWQNSDITIINDGLSAGDVLVTTPLGQVISGTPVIINQLNGADS